MTQPPIGRTRLYNQIVYPLLVASVVVGVVATLVAVYFLSDLTNTWVHQTAASSTENMSRRFELYVAQMQQVARIAASTGAISEASGANDLADLHLELITDQDILKMDAVYVTDRDGKVVARSGVRDVEVGEALFREPRESGRATVSLDDFSGSTRIVVCQPIPSSENRYTIVLTRVVDDSFLRDLGLIDQSAFCIYDAPGKRIAFATGDGLSSRVKLGLNRATGRYSRSIEQAVRHDGTPPSPIRVNQSDFEVHVEPIMLSETSYARTFGYVVGVVSQRVSEDAGRTTTQLIFMWSVVAVICLGGLGGWVARRVSDPLVELAMGARRIADGDFSTKVNVKGANEIAELAGTFNEMTDSLHERSETLTKKVLELSTLYDMSRSLGSTLDLDELLGSVLDSALRIFDVDSGYITLRDKDDGEIRTRALRGGGASAARTSEKSSMSEWVIREGRPLIFNPDANVLATRMDSVTGATAALCVPLISAEGTIGSVTIGSTDINYRFTSDDVRLLSTIANHVTIAIGNIELFSSLQEAYLATVRSLAAAVDAKDSYTRGHSERVATYATLIAEHMALSHEQRIALEMAAYLHDIGKIGVREEILLKPGPLTADEVTLMRHHPLIGANILKPVAFPWAITPIVRHHHESFDGTGYPSGLRGDEIPLLARVLSVADSFEAMTASRPYREGMSVALAIEEMNRCAGTQFDPRIVGVFVEVLGALEEEGDPTRPESADEVLPDEARGVFAALIDGLFSSFRRLGGPRLSSNVEGEVDAFLSSNSMPFRISRGRLTFTADSTDDVDDEIEQMRTTLLHIDTLMSRVSGAGLVDHFYEDAFRTFSARMRHLAQVLGFTNEG